MKIYDLRDGKHCRIYRGARLEKFTNLFGRDRKNICLKVFTNPIGDKDFKEFIWGDKNQGINLFDASRIQNYLWAEGFASRVYGLLKVKLVDKKIYPCQMVEDVGNPDGTQEEADYIYEKAIEIGKVYGFEINGKGDVSAYDVINGKLVDFNTFKLTKDHKDKIRDLVYEHGKWGKNHYQEIPELDIRSLRKTKDRIKWMELDKINFEDKSVFDLGCSSGVFCNYAAEMGARSVFGIDDDKNIKAARILSSYLGYFNNDYYSIDLKTRPPEKTGADIVFFLSMMYHIGIPEWLPKITKELCIVEWNNYHKGILGKDMSQEESEKGVEEILNKMFKKVERKGRGEDHGGKQIWWCS